MKPKYYRCEDCCKIYWSEKQYEQHMRKVHDGKN